MHRQGKEVLVIEGRSVIESFTIEEHKDKTVVFAYYFGKRITKAQHGLSLLFWQTDIKGTARDMLTGCLELISLFKV